MLNNSKRSIDAMIKQAVDKKEEFFNASYVVLDHDKKSQEVLDVFTRKNKNPAVKEKSTKQGVQINKKDDIIVNIDSKTKGEKPKESAAE
jgi:septum formation inhibitor MinC